MASKRSGPVLIWAGGKSKHVHKLDPHLPESFNRYYEPFFGGGSLFFHLKPKKATLSDLNKELIRTWKTVRDRPRELMETLEEEFVDPDDKVAYCLRLDGLNAGEYKGVRRAACFIYLNKRSYGGVMRYRKHGRLYASYATNKPQPIFTKKSILKASRRLKKARIIRQDYREIKPKKGDFVFLDPPYIDSASFYSNDFSHEDTEEFHDWVKGLPCNWMITNFDHPKVQKDLKGFNFTPMKTRNTFREGEGAKLGARIKDEVIITNY